MLAKRPQGTGRPRWCVDDGDAAHHEAVPEVEQLLGLVGQGPKEAPPRVAVALVLEPAGDPLAAENQQQHDQPGQEGVHPMGGVTRAGGDEAEDDGDDEGRRAEVADQHAGVDHPPADPVVHHVLGLGGGEPGAGEGRPGLEAGDLGGQPGGQQDPGDQPGEDHRDHGDEDEGGDGVHGFIVAAGFTAGCLTGIFATKFKINSLLAGILMMTILYSVNLRIMGRANIPLLNRSTLFTPMESLDISRDLPVIIFFLIIAVVCKLAIDVFLHTEYGLALRATGDNEQMIRALGVNTDTATIFGLGLSNAMVALAGALIAQDQGFSDVGMGIGMIVAGLASIIIGEALFKPTTVVRLTSAALIGSVVYRFIIALGMRLGLAPTDLKLATGLMVVIALAVPAIRGKREKKLKLRGV